MLGSPLERFNGGGTSAVCGVADGDAFGEAGCDEASSAGSLGLAGGSTCGEAGGSGAG